MASGDGKSNPFGNGSSGAVGNGSGGSQEGMKNHRGPDRAQKMGPDATLNPSSIPSGGRILKLDPPSDRKGLVGQTAEGGMKNKPYKWSDDHSTENSDSDATDESDF